MTMKKLHLVLLTTLASGCSVLTRPPDQKLAQQLEQAKQANERELLIRDRAADLEKRGLSSREARAISDTEYKMSGRR